MSKEIYYKLSDELGRPPTEEEVADAMADLIDYALEAHQEKCMGCVVPRDTCGACRTAKWNFKYRATKVEEEQQCPCGDASRINCAYCQDLPLRRMG